MGGCVDTKTELINSYSEQFIATYTAAQQSKVARINDFYAKATCFDEVFGQVCREYNKGNGSLYSAINALSIIPVTKLELRIIL